MGVKFEGPGLLNAGKGICCLGGSYVRGDFDGGSSLWFVNEVLVNGDGRKDDVCGG